MKKIFPALLGLIVLFASCKKENVPAPTNPIGGMPGFGTSTEAFSGTNWQLPQGIILKDSIRDAQWWTDIEGGLPIAVADYRGLPGGLFKVCLFLENTTGQAITIDFPEEILLLSNTIETQNGIIIELETITIPAHSETVIIAGVFCINLERDVPELYTSAGNLQAYSFGPATVPAGIKEITNILRPKNIRYSDMFVNGMLDVTRLSQMMIVQSALWEVTDDDGLTAETKAELQALDF